MSTKNKADNSNSIDVLSVCSEIFPLVKTGGLADVTGALPGALLRLDVRVRTLLPLYPVVADKLGKSEVVAELADLFGGPARVLAGEIAGLDLLLIEAEHLYDRAGPIYQQPEGPDWPDNWKRFGALSHVAGQIAQGLIKDYRPEIVHGHDWQAGLMPAYVSHGRKKARPKTVMTIHNLAFQGHFAHEIFSELKLPAAADGMDGVEYYGGVGFLKAGLQYADALTTVSPTYAAEITTTDFGMGLDGLLRLRVNDLHGILNGIDLDAWDPGTDEALLQNYRASSKKRRAINKTAVRERFGLEDSDAPIFSVISRLTWQKGMDVFAQLIDQIVALGAQVAVLGSGDSAIEAALAAAAARHPGQMGIVIGYDESLSHLMQGGADAIVIPSRFEPCGLTQLIGLRYGCVPVVARTGGLADTVIDANEAAIAAGVATGVQFNSLSEDALMDALRRTVRLFHQPSVWSNIQRRGMKADVGWNVSARRYAELYGNLVGRRVLNDD